MDSRNWIDFEPGRHFLSAYEISKNILRVNSHKFLVGLTIVGKHAWQQEECKGYSSTVLVIQEHLFILELVKDNQDAILLILYCRTMFKFRADLSNIFPYWIWIQSLLYRQLWINTISEEMITVLTRYRPIVLELI